MKSYSCSRTYYLRCLQENADNIEAQSIPENARNSDAENERQLDPEFFRSGGDGEPQRYRRFGNQCRPCEGNSKRINSDGRVRPYFQILRDFANQLGDQPTSKILRDIANERERRSKTSM